MEDDMLRIYLANIEITPREVKSMLERGEKFLFVDVRETWELETSRIEGAMLIPLGEIPASLAKFEEAGRRHVLSVIMESAASTRRRGCARRE